MAELGFGEGGFNDEWEAGAACSRPPLCKHDQPGSAVAPCDVAPGDAARYMLTRDDRQSLGEESLGTISRECSCCEPITLKRIIRIIEDNKVAFMRCGAAEYTWEEQCWAMDWQGRLIRPGWGQWEPLAKISAKMRQKRGSVQDLKKCQQDRNTFVVRGYNDIAGSKRDRESPGEQQPSRAQRPPITSVNAAPTSAVSSKPTAAAAGQAPPDQPNGTPGHMQAEEAVPNAAESAAESDYVLAPPPVPGDATSAPTPSVQQPPHRPSQPPLPSSQAPPGAAAADEGKKLRLQFLETFSRGSGSARLLHYFLEHHSNSAWRDEHLENTELIKLCMADLEKDENLAKVVVESIGEMLPPTSKPPPEHPDLDTVAKVLDFAAKDLLNMKSDWSPWNKAFGNLPQEAFLKFVDAVVVDAVQKEIRSHSIAPGASFGVFFVMSHGLAKYILFIARHKGAVQDRLIALDYMALEHFQGAECAEGDSIICGYNRGVCPAWAQPDGWSFLGHDILEEQRDFVKQLGDEYRQRVENYRQRVENLEREEEDGKEKMEAGTGTTLPEVEAGATEDAMERAGEEDECPICLDALHDEITSLAECNHRYHTQCIEHHFLYDRRCPQCRTVVPDPAVSEATRLRDKLAKAIITCRQSGKEEARELLDQETLALIKPMSVRAMGARHATRSAGGRRTASGRALGEASEELSAVEQALADLHDFCGANGVETSDWVVQITATQHDGKDDEVGVRMGPHTLPDTFPVATYETGADYRRYRVSHGQLLKVKVKNLSAKPLSFQPVYVSAEGNEEPEEFIEPLKQGEEYELPYPLEKEVGENEDGWALKDVSGATVLRLRFILEGEKAMEVAGAEKVGPEAGATRIPAAGAGGFVKELRDDYRLRRDELLEREKEDMPRAAAAGARGEAGTADSGGKLHTPTVRQHTYSAAQVGAAVTGAAEAVAAVSERLRLWNELDQVSSTCRQSDTRARDLLDPETRALIGRMSATTKGHGGASTRSGTSTTRGVSSGRETKDEDLQMVEQVLAELHDFSGADGVDTSDWVLQVTVKQHDGKDDDKGERIESPKECGADYRLYAVCAKQLIKVKIKNLSAKPLSFQPVYVDTEGNEEPEEFTAPLKQGEEHELPYPLEKADGETEDAWALKDGKGVIVLKLRFQVQRK